MIMMLILHRFQVMAEYVKYLLARGSFVLTPLLAGIPCEYRYK